MKALLDQYRRDTSTPAVADGEDEGSQRSAATPDHRMWPLVSHINTERVFCPAVWMVVHHGLANE